MRTSISRLAGLLLVVAAPLLAADLPVAPVEFRRVDVVWTAEAVVEAVSQATVAAQVQGRVIEARMDAGARVRRGDVLMRIDEREAADALAGSEAQVAQARAGLANAQAAFERTKRLVERKFVSQAALDQARAAYLAAQAQLEQALAGRGQARTVRGFTVITSPLTGIVARRHVEAGEMAVPGKPLITVFEPGALRVVANVPQYRFGDVARTGRARVEFPETGRTIGPVSVTLLPTADAHTHSAVARLALPTGLDGLLPGMFARVHFLVGQARRLVVPVSAILRRGEVTAAYVIDARGATHLRQVRLGDQEWDGRVEVLAGLAAGERVALDPVRAGILAGGAAK